MPFTDSALRTLPDIASEAPPGVAGELDWVGMDDIAMPIAVAGSDGRDTQTGARVSARVNLIRPEARGIHMSRLYLHLDKALSGQALTPCSLRRVLRDFLDSQVELSDRAMLRLEFEQLLRRPALVSDNSGWKSYPVSITALMDRGHFTVELGCEVAYSSTCPCSAALARQLIQERFSEDFARGRPLDHDTVLTWLGSEQGVCATPHSQRSAAEVRVKLTAGFDLPIVDVIDAVEGALKTPVQTAVKREDEQAFARLNGANLMFCEDAARRIRTALDGDERVSDYRVRTTHYESLHAHDAVAVVTKGVVGGYAA
ncbi:MAG TPA: GTP cyclohydrolase FolE2 [Rhodanobacteraceae bacterium]|nr:GTP cyclohydrolase FolE2 [Rhodanobacteraceae bacterium]